MKLLITGSEGSLAQIVIPRLLEAEHQIIGIDSLTRYGDVERNRNYQFIHADLCETSSIQRIFQENEFDAVFHFAALVYGTIGIHKRPADIIANNSLATINLLKFGHERIKHFVYLSSSMVYEKSFKWPHQEDDTESTPVMSTSYGLSKYMGERVVRSFEQQYGVKYVIWRPFNIITPFEVPEEEGYSHVFTDLIEKIIVKKQNPLDILGDGGQIRCFTSIYDVAEVIANYSLKPEAVNQTINIGNPEPVTIKELAESIVKIAKKLGILDSEYELKYNSLPIHATDVKKRVPDVSKMKKEFGWQATIKLDQSIESHLKTRFNS